LPFSTTYVASSAAAADVFHGVDPLGGDGQRVACAVCLGADPIDRVLQLAFQDVDDLFTRMPVPKRRRLRAKLDAVLDDHASGDTEVVLLQIGPPDACTCWTVVLGAC
jgi:hypothetical protein